MKILKNKKLIISILIVTLIVIICNSIITAKQSILCNNKINSVIANIVGVIKQEYPQTNDGEIVSILNSKNGLSDEGYEILGKYNIDSESSVIEELKNQKKEQMQINIVSIIILLILIMTILFIYENKRNKKIQNIIKYIEIIN